MSCKSWEILVGTLKHVKSAHMRTQIGQNVNWWPLNKLVGVTFSYCENIYNFWTCCPMIAGLFFKIICVMMKGPNKLSNLKPQC